VENQLNAMELLRGFHDIYIELNDEYYFKISYANSLGMTNGFGSFKVR